MVNTAYTAMNTEGNLLDKMIATAQQSASMAGINLAQNQNLSEIQEEVIEYVEDPMQIIMNNQVSSFNDSVSYSGVAQGILQTAKGVNNTVSAVKNKPRGIISEILSWFGF